MSYKSKSACHTVLCPSPLWAPWGPSRGALGGWPPLEQREEGSPQPLILPPGQEVGLGEGVQELLISPFPRPPSCPLARIPGHRKRWGGGPSPFLEVAEVGREP